MIDLKYVLSVAEKEGATGRGLGLALAKLSESAEVRESVAMGNAEVDERNAERFKQGCLVHGVTQWWWDDGHGGVCGICDD